MNHSHTGRYQAAPLQLCPWLDSVPSSLLEGIESTCCSSMSDLKTLDMGVGDSLEEQIDTNRWAANL